MMKSPYRCERGFSLVEVLIVVGIMGLIMGSVYSLFKVHRNTAYSQVEVVEVQQNLRVALDNISRDLRSAGIMLTLGTNPIASATGSPAFPTYASDIRINVASAEGRFARVTAKSTTAATTTLTLTVEAPATAASPNVIDGFADGDNVRIIRPVSGSQPISSDDKGFVISAMNRTANTITIGRQDTLNFIAAEDVVPGDIITKVTAAATFPETVDYYLVNAGTAINGIVCPNNQRCLVREVNADALPPGPSDIIATKMSALTFGYLDDSYGEAAVPSDLASLRAVRVTLTGATATSAALSGGARSRAITSIIKLRNRR